MRTVFQAYKIMSAHPVLHNKDVYLLLFARKSTQRRVGVYLWNCFVWNDTCNVMVESGLPRSDED